MEANIPKNVPQPLLQCTRIIEKLENISKNSITSNSKQTPNPLRRFKHAGYGFLLLNLIYLALAIFFIPPFNISLTTILSLLAFVLLLGVCTYYLFQAKKLLAQFLAVIYGARSVFAAYSFFAGDTFPAVPYFLPCLLITFYLLVRAGWNWP
tara:strand:+ start:515 stop:970 length:456 start_codon:yes stop_codon:yes gene_type:complete